MILSNIHMIGKGIQDVELNIKNLDKKKSIIKFTDVIAFPGLINSHDHLDFNLFPTTGNRVYKNYTEWAADVQEHNGETFKEILKIPKALRIQYGLYKNLLNGFTTVVNHGEQIEIENDLINVFQNCHSLHSVLLEKNWKRQLNNPFAKKQPYVIHAGEGTDQQSADEIDELIKWNVFKKELIAVHGVSMNEQQAKNFKALVWCPASNYFLLNDTAKVDRLKQSISIVFGTDSTLSSGWNAWEHIRLARKTGMVTDQELFDMLTINPAKLWGLNNILKTDLVVAQRKNEAGEFGAFFSLNPEDILLIIRNSNIILLDESLSDLININLFDEVLVGDKFKFIRQGITDTLRQIKLYSDIIPKFS